MSSLFRSITDVNTSKNEAHASGAPSKVGNFISGSVMVIGAIIGFVEGLLLQVGCLEFINCFARLATA